jgi:hypothetical protein
MAKTKKAASAPRQWGFTDQHIKALEAISRGHETTEGVAWDMQVHPRLAQALLEDLRDGGYLEGAKK